MAHGTSDVGPGVAKHIDEGEHEHPGELTYIKVAAVLAAITIVEVAIYYFDLSRSLLVALLLILSAIKFVTVVGYFMHLKFDDRRLTWIFGGGLVIAVSIILALDVLGDVHPIDYAKDLIG